MRFIGTIRQLQIQRSPMKTGEGAQRRYNPAPLLVVDELRLTPMGAFGRTADGGEIMDVHHLKHSQSRNTGKNSVSFNFTSHYAKMRGHLGEHLVDGVAAENILIESDAHYLQPDLGDRLIIQHPQTQDIVVLYNVIDAPPCEPFARFAAREPIQGAQLKGVLQFLDEGTRGFYCALTDAEARIYTGDRVYIE
jgi:hypothetical protein